MVTKIDQLLCIIDSFFLDWQNGKGQTTDLLQNSITYFYKNSNALLIVIPSN
jgi:hypothetical protein|tara:strand:- start:253 stop:408 length:156 start_codon:yes stop_codon:yes gene_type:complete